jgi:hypothetical protein
MLRPASSWQCIGFPLTAAHQAKVVNFLLNTLPRVSPEDPAGVPLRMARPAAKRTSWDSALIGPDNRPRAAYYVLANTLDSWGITPNCALSELPPACQSVTADSSS